MNHMFPSNLTLHPPLPHSRIHSHSSTLTQSIGASAASGQSYLVVCVILAAQHQYQIRTLVLMLSIDAVLEYVHSAAHSLSSFLLLLLCTSSLKSVPLTNEMRHQLQVLSCGNASFISWCCSQSRGPIHSNPAICVQFLENPQTNPNPNSMTGITPSVHEPGAMRGNLRTAEYVDDVVMWLLVWSP